MSPVTKTGPLTYVRLQDSPSPRASSSSPSDLQGKQVSFPSQSSGSPLTTARLSNSLNITVPQGNTSQTSSLLIRAQTEQPPLASKVQASVTSVSSDKTAERTPKSPAKVLSSFSSQSSSQAENLSALSLMQSNSNTPSSGPSPKAPPQATQDYSDQHSIAANSLATAGAALRRCSKKISERLEELSNSSMINQMKDYENIISSLYSQLQEADSTLRADKQKPPDNLIPLINKIYQLERDLDQQLIFSRYNDILQPVGVGPRNNSSYMFLTTRSNEICIPASLARMDKDNNLIIMSKELAKIMSFQLTIEEAFKQPSPALQKTFHLASQNPSSAPRASHLTPQSTSGQSGEQEPVSPSSPRTPTSLKQLRFAEDENKKK